MLILTQSQEMIINLKNITILMLDERNDFYTITYPVDNKIKWGANLGMYETKERCQRIMFDIMQEYQKGAKCYEMPQS